MRTCDIEGCDNKHVAKGLCEKHRWHTRKAYAGRNKGGPIGRPPRAEYNYARAKEFLEDGASYRETAYTLSIPRTTLQENLPGMGWAIDEGGKFKSFLTSSPRIQRIFYEDLFDNKRRQY